MKLLSIILLVLTYNCYSCKPNHSTMDTHEASMFKDSCDCNLTVDGNLINREQLDVLGLSIMGDDKTFFNSKFDSNELKKLCSKYKKCPYLFVSITIVDGNIVRIKFKNLIDDEDMKEELLEYEKRFVDTPSSFSFVSSDYNDYSFRVPLCE